MSDNIIMECSNDSIDDILVILKESGIKVEDKKKKRNPGITILEDILIYKPDAELLEKINEINPPENSTVLCMQPSSTIPISDFSMANLGYTSNICTMDELSTNSDVTYCSSPSPTLLEDHSGTTIFEISNTSVIAELSKERFEFPRSNTPSPFIATSIDSLGISSVVDNAVAEESFAVPISIISLPITTSIISSATSAVVDNIITEERIAAPISNSIDSSATSIIVDAATDNVPKRRKHAIPEDWKKNVTKEKRMRGESYFGYARNSNKVVTSGISRSGRKIGPACETDFCQKSSKRFCSLFTEDERQNIFNNFWKELDWSAKKSFVCSMVDKIPVKQKKTETVKRSETLVYYLKLNGEAHQVCKKMFLNTVGLKERMVFNWLNKSKEGIPLIETNKDTSNRGKQKLTNIPNEAGVTQADHLNFFFEQIPKLPSHYCRSTSSKLYLEPVFKSKSHLYDIYKQKCNEESVQPVSNCYFDNKFEDLKLSIFKPKKDKCDLCCGFEAKNISQEEYDIHFAKKRAARLEKEADKKLGFEGKQSVICMDVQSVKVCPKVEASAVYFKTKLCCHNFTIYNMVTNEVVCYWWHECEGELQASNFASCLIDYINEKVPKDVPLIIYSDGCTSQNRNATMANGLLDLAIKENMLIIQKYLEKGHTQMECDSVHSVIEIKLKNTDIYVPNQYATITKDAKKKNPKYEVKYLSFNFFKDFTSLQRYKSIRPGKKTGDPTVTDMRQLNYEPTGKIRYKLLFSDGLQDLPSRPKLNINSVLKPMYTERIPLKPRKWKDLQDLKAILPRDFHSFYDTLPTKTD